MTEQSNAQTNSTLDVDSLLAALKPFADAYAPEAARIDKYYTDEDKAKYGPQLDGNTITPAGSNMGHYRRAFEAYQAAMTRRTASTTSAGPADLQSRFEAWAAPRGYWLARQGSEYRDPATIHAWEVWQASETSSASAALAEIDNLINEISTDDARVTAEAIFPKEPKPLGWLAGSSNDGMETLYYSLKFAQDECDQHNAYERSRPDFDPVDLRYPQAVYAEPARATTQHPASCAGSHVFPAGWLFRGEQTVLYVESNDRPRPSFVVINGNDRVVSIEPRYAASNTAGPLPDESSIVEADRLSDLSAKVTFATASSCSSFLGYLDMVLKTESTSHANVQGGA